MPRRKFNREQADKMWSSYTKGLVDSLKEAEKEGLEKGLSSYEIERLWQEKTRQKTEKSKEQ
jgi:hypothetical protein